MNITYTSASGSLSLVWWDKEITRPIILALAFAAEAQEKIGEGSILVEDIAAFAQSEEVVYCKHAREFVFKTIDFHRNNADDQWVNDATNMILRNEPVSTEIGWE